MDLTPNRLRLEPWQREQFERNMHAAPTVSETLFWGWLLGIPCGARLLFEELLIVDFEGPGDVPDNFVGVGSE